jgi:hypothetical protein
MLLELMVFGKRSVDLKRKCAHAKPTYIYGMQASRAISDRMILKRTFVAQWQ